MLKVLIHLLLPPGVFIIGFVVLSILAYKNKTVRLLSMSLAITLYLLSIEPVKDMLYKPLEESYPIPSKVEGDVIIVLGGGSYNTGILKEDSLKRLLTGFVLHKQTGKPIILSGGSGINQLPDAEIMKATLLSLGVDLKSILLDSGSTTTQENAKYSKSIMEKKKYKVAILVTSAYHMKRAVKAFQKEKVEILPYPTDFKRDLRYNVYSFVPKASALNESYKALREYIANLAYDLSM